MALTLASCDTDEHILTIIDEVPLLLRLLLFNTSLALASAYRESLPA